MVQPEGKCDLFGFIATTGLPQEPRAATLVGKIFSSSKTNAVSIKKTNATVFLSLKRWEAWIVGFTKAL